MRWTVIEKGDNCVLKLGKPVASYFSERQKNVEKALAHARLGGHDARGERRKSALRDLRYSRVHLHSPTLLFFCRIKRPLAVYLTFQQLSICPNFWAIQGRFSFSSIFNARMCFLPLCDVFDFLGLFPLPTPVVLNWFLHIFTCREWPENFGIILK